MLKSHAFFEDLQKTPPREQLEHMLEFCISMKRDVVEEDEFDTGARQYLNLGHTFGHAVEAAQRVFHQPRLRGRHRHGHDDARRSEERLLQRRYP